MPIWGAALRGFGKALKKARGKGKVYKTIKSVKPLSGKIPWYVSAGKTAEGRAKTVKTWKRVGTDEAITKAQKGITEGKKKLEHLEATGWAKELKGYKGKRTGIYHRKQQSD